jgi:hypothetical protein
MKGQDRQDQGRRIKNPGLDVRQKGGPTKIVGTPQRDFTPAKALGQKGFHGEKIAVQISEEQGLARVQQRGVKQCHPGHAEPQNGINGLGFGFAHGAASIDLLAAAGKAVNRQ